MCSARRLTKRNISVQFNENHSKGLRDMERTRIEGQITFLKCDLDLESA